MANDVETIPLSELCVRITKGTTPTTLGRTFKSEGINFVKSEAITPDGRIDVSTFAFIDAETHNALSRSILQENDILFSMAGVYLGKTAVVNRSILPANTNQAVGIIRPDRSKANPRFIHYVLSSPSTRSLVHRSVAQSAQPNFNLQDIGNLPIPKLPIREQNAVSCTLGMLDDRIELNRKMNEMLEGIARALFKSWFVDFDPVRAKAEGRSTGLPKRLADLFPSSLDESEIGEVPQGWCVVPLPDAIEVNPVRLLRRGQSAPYLDMANMPTNGHAPDFVADRPFGSGMRFTEGDTLVARITPCLENGKTAYVDFLKQQQVGWGSTEYIVMRPKEPFPPQFAYYLARSARFREFAILSMTGSSGRQRVPVEALTHFKIALPSNGIAVEFGRLVSPLMGRVRAGVDQSATLAKLRDALLPKLVSGELRVPDAERVVGEQLNA